MRDIGIKDQGSPATHVSGSSPPPRAGAARDFAQLLSHGQAEELPLPASPSSLSTQRVNSSMPTTLTGDNRGQLDFASADMVRAQTAPSFSGASAWNSTPAQASPFGINTNSSWMSGSFVQFLMRMMEAVQALMAQFSGQQSPGPVATNGGGQDLASAAPISRGGGNTQGASKATVAPSGSAPSACVMSGGKLPAATGERLVNETIVVKAGETFDGQGVHFKAGPALGDGGQGEHQRPVFVLEPGAKLKNVQLSGADGVHAKGDARLDNVWWRDVGEDAFTLKGQGHVEVHGGGAFNASDKIFQLNAGGSFHLEGFTADTFGKAVRTNGGKDFAIAISVTNSTFTNGQESVVRSDATQATIRLSNNRISNTRYDVIAPQHANVQGATMRGWKSYTG